jgi:Cu(I)/Ag(I) efflux system membrane fusion protein
MSRKLIVVAALIAAIVVGIVIGRSLPQGEMSMDMAGEAEREVLYWVAPMDPDFRRDEPGLSPMGMDLKPVYADAMDAVPGTVKIDPTVVNNLGVRTTVAEESPLSRRIETVGYVGYDEDTLMHVHLRVDGWIEGLSVTTTGDAVKKGQVLFELYSPTLVNAQEEFLMALTSESAALTRASRERLESLGMTLGEIDDLARERKVKQRIRKYAMQDGVVAHLGAREGMFVTPASNVMSIAELDRVWVLAEVFERQAAWVTPGQPAEVELDYLPGRKWQGTVDYVYPELDATTRTLKVRIRFENEGELLRPNMFARVTLLDLEAESMVHVPREALIRGGDGARVVLSLGEGRFRSQLVETGIESGNRVAILSGISAGDRIVTSGQFMIDSESDIDSALSKMDEHEAEQ